MAKRTFNKEQRRYIKANFKTMSKPDMAKNLKCDIKDIDDVLKELDLLDEGPVHKALPLRKLGKIDFLWGIPAFLLPFIIYCMTLCRTLFVGDSGEFSAQGSVLGIAHPPGYPMWTLMLKCAVTLFSPIMEHQAARGALLCAIVAGATTYFLYILLLKLSHYRTIALMGSMLFGFCYHFWSQALFSEVFILNVFFTVVTMLLMLLWSETQEQRYILTLYFVTAMAMAHHNLFLVMPLLYSYFIVCSLFKKWDVKWEFIYVFIYGLVGGILYLVSERLANLFSWWLINQPMPPGDTFGTKFVLAFLTFVPYTLGIYWYHKRDRVILYAALLFILGFCMYIYIPMRMLSHPAMSWGYPQTVEDIYNHISRRQYGPLSPIPRVWPFPLGHPLNGYSIFGPSDIVKEQFLEYWMVFFRQFGSFLTEYKDTFLLHFNRMFIDPGMHIVGGKLALMVLWTASWCSMMILGIWRLLRQNGKYFVLTLLAFLFYGPGMQAVLNYQTTNHSMYIIFRFLIPSYLIASIWIAFGAQQIMEWFKYGFQIKGLPPIPDFTEEEEKKTRMEGAIIPEITRTKEVRSYPMVLRIVGCVLILAVPIVPLTMNYWHQDLSKNSVAYDFGMNILNSMTQDGKIFIIGDNPTFALAYLSYVEKKINPEQIFDEGENLFVMIHDFGKDKFRTPVHEHNRLKDIGRARVTMTSTTPVFYMSVQNTNAPQEDPDRYKDYSLFPQVRQLPSGIVYQAVRPGEKEPNYEATLERMKNLDPFFDSMATDYYTRELVSNYHFLMGRAYYQLSDNITDPVKKAAFKAKAFDEFKNTSRTGWDLDNMHINLANVFKQENRIDESIAEFKQAILTQPRKAISYFQLGDIYRSQNKTTEAIDMIKKGLSLGIYDNDANDPTAYYLLGTLEIQEANNIRKDRPPATLAGDERRKWEALISDSLTQLQTCVMINPNYQQAYQSLGEAYYFMGDYENAVAMWEKVISMNPGFYPALMNMAIYYKDVAKDPARAQEYYSRAMQAMQAMGQQPQGAQPQQRMR